MTTATQLRQIAVDILKGATDAGQSVYSPRDWATWEEDYPDLLVTLPEEAGESLGRNGAPHFNVVATLRITARVCAATRENDLGAVDALVALERIREQIKAALINHPVLMRQLQQYAGWHAKTEVTANGGNHLGELTIDLDLEFFQGPDDFYQPDATPLTETRMDLSLATGRGSVSSTLDIKNS